MVKPVGWPPSFGVRAFPTDSSDRRVIGRVLRELREEGGLTQERIADLTGISPVYVSELESGHRNPSYIVLARLLRAIGKSWQELGERLDATTR